MGWRQGPAVLVLDTGKMGDRGVAAQWEKGKREAVVEGNGRKTKGIKEWDKEERREDLGA